MRIVGGVLALLLVWWPSGVVYADVLTSPNYKFTETTIGNGGLIQSESANFQSSLSIGDTAVGTSTSSNYQLDAGSTTSDDPTLSFTVNGGSINFTDFSATATATATSTFSVSNYTSYGYVVQILGTPPTNGAASITPMATTGPPQVGIKQFGINLVANTVPTSFGANPNVGQFGTGYAAPNYDTPNEYRYVSGETIAMADSTSGITAYTISYIVNVDALTPGGKYTSNQVIICTGTY